MAFTRKGRAMHRPRFAGRLTLLTTLIVLAVPLAACSKDDTPTAAPSATATGGSTPTGTAADPTSADHRIAQAKTIAVGFFEAQAVNDYDKASSRSSGGALLTVRWAQAVNGISAAKNTGYQVAAVTAPNVRVQIDALDQVSDGRWAATGFVELSFRPGPVASTTSTTAAPGTTAAPATTPPSTYAVDMVFIGDGDHLKLDDYRLDDTPYPVSQLFVELRDVRASVDGLEGTINLGHRDLDGSVQYVAAITDQGTAPAVPATVSFTPPTSGTTTTVKLAAAKGTLFADPAPANGEAATLIVFPGLFPGGAGTVELGYPAGGGTIPPRTLAFTVPDFPALTPRPLNTVPSTTVPGASTTSGPSTTSSTSSASTTTAPGPTTTVTGRSSTTVLSGPTSTTPTPSSTSTTTSTSPSLTTTTKAP